MKHKALNFKLLIILVLFSFTQLKAQILDPVQWSFSVNRVSNQEAVLIFTANIEETWHLYGVEIPDGGPIATSFTYETNSDKFNAIGQIKEPKGKTKYDANFEMDLKLFDDKAVFKQKIKT